MNIGFLGLGKLGLPCALAIKSKGHQVFGYDINSSIEKNLNDKKLPYKELWAQEYIEKYPIKFENLTKVVELSDIIFVPIQTPHKDLYEGVTRLPKEREDFDYSLLKEGVKNLAKEIKKQKKDKIVVIISTVLPGTIEREIRPLLNKNIKLCYNPFFIAMGTTIKDFLFPEFVLFGVDDQKACEKVEEFYKTLHDKPIYKCSIEEAELIKVTYNTYITMKICLANTVMELSHKLKNINCDNVMKALFLANERLISGKYLLGGMGDGGGCHPRDNIALSWLAKKINLSYDWYENLMICREKQTEWLVNLIIQEHNKTKLPIIILGKTFKKETSLTTGSPAILLKNILQEYNIPVAMYDPFIDTDKNKPLEKKSIYFIATNHDEFNNYSFPNQSIVIDPWRTIKKQNKKIKIINIGDSYGR